MSLKRIEEELNMATEKRENERVWRAHVMLALFEILEYLEIQSSTTARKKE